MVAGVEEGVKMAIERSGRIQSMPPRRSAGRPPGSPEMGDPAAGAAPASPGRGPYASDEAGAALAALDWAAARVGDRWTLLIVNALLVGPLRFGELAEALPGIASNVLSQRLKRLEADRLV